MRVNYVTPADESMPAVRYRMKLPGEYIGDYEISMVPVEADIHFFCKPYHQDPYLLNAYRDMSSRLTYVFDICDDIFNRDGPVPQYMRDMAKGATAVTVPTEVMQKRVKEETGIDAVIISDPFEFEELECKSIENPKLMWFGSDTNFSTLKFIETDYPIELITKNTKDVKKMRNLCKFPHTFTEWSMENMRKAFNRNNVVIIPTYSSSTKAHNYIAKSPNRVVESIRSGMAVVCSPIPSYLQFGEWVTLDWDVNNGIKNLKKMCPDGQKYVRDNFNISIIGEQWKTLFDSILGVEQKSLRAG